MSIRIMEVPLKMVWQMRREVMYPEFSLHEVKLADDEEGTHLGLYDGGVLCSIISLFRRGNELQFRKFATAAPLQGQGYGTKLLRHVFAQATETEVKKIWCNARTTALDLYRKFGMAPYGNEWEEHGRTFIKMQVEL